MKITEVNIQGHTRKEEAWWQK